MQPKTLVLSLVAAITLTLLLAGPTAAADPPHNLDKLAAALPDSTLLKGKVVYVDFWASWCVPCRQSLPWMKSLSERYADKGLQVIAVNLDKNHAAAEKFLSEMPVPFPIVFDSTGNLAKAYDLQAMPTSFVYGRNGTLESTHLGFRTEDAADLDSLVRSLLSQKVTRDDPDGGDK